MTLLGQIFTKMVENIVMHNKLTTFVTHLKQETKGGETVPRSEIKTRLNQYIFDIWMGEKRKHISNKKCYLYYTTSLIKV